MLGKLDRLQDHFIICGGGRMGRVVAEEMKHSNQPFVVVDRIQDRLKLIEEAHGEVCTIEGDATKEHTLEMARIDTARGLACCLSDDGDNLLLCLTARGLRPELSIVARANDQESLEKLRRAGANHAISPNYTGAVRVAAALLRPSIVSFLDSATSGAGISLRLEQATVPEHSELVGQSLADVRIPQRTGLVVLALRRHNDGPQIYNPGPETKLEGNDEVIVLGGPEQIEKLRTYFGH